MLENLRGAGFETFLVIPFEFAANLRPQNFGNGFAYNGFPRKPDQLLPAAVDAPDGKPAVFFLANQKKPERNIVKDRLLFPQPGLQLGLVLRL